MKGHYKAITMTKIFQTDHIDVGKDVGQLGFSSTAGRDEKQPKRTANGLVVSCKGKYRTTLWLGNPTPRYLPRRCLRREVFIQRLVSGVHRNFVHNSPKLDTTQMPTDWLTG